MNAEAEVKAPAASSIVRSRYWREFDGFVSARSERMTPPAVRLLSAEGLRAATQFEQNGMNASLESVQEDDWIAYIGRVWIGTAPDVADVVEPFLAVVKAGIPKDVLTRAAALWVRENGAREAGEITRTSRRNISNQIRIGIEKRESIDQIADRIRKHYKSVTPARAATIARTEVHAAANFGSLTVASEQREPMRKMWVATPDNITRDAHAEMNGQTKLLSDPFTYEGEKLMFPGDSSLGCSAEMVVNCFPADTLISADGVKACYRRWYDGELIEIKTTSGDKLSGTPNHPVLTRRGWVRLGHLEEADEIVQCRVRERVNVAGPNVVAMPTPIGKVFDSHVVSGERITASGVNFHGDVADGDVDIVLTNSQLRNAGKTASGEHATEQRFAFANQMQGALPGSGETFGSLSGHGFTHGGVGWCDQRAAFLWSEAGQPERVRFASGASGNTGVVEHSFDDIAGDTKAVSERRYRIASEISGGRLIIETVLNAGAPSELVGVLSRSSGYPQSIHPTVNGRCRNAKVSSDGDGRQTAVIDAPQLISRWTLEAARGVAIAQDLLRRSDGDSEVAQPFSDGRFSDAEMRGGLVCAEGFFVETTKLAHIRRIKFSGHVYNLETATGWYAANNIVAHNCRCTLWYERVRRPRRPAA